MSSRVDPELASQSKPNKHTSLCNSSGEAKHRKILGRSLPLMSEVEVDRRQPPSMEEQQEDEEEEVGSSSTLWNQDGWALTWPIWHLLPLQERKQLAHNHGYKTIGEFEEYMSLHRAMDDSETVESRPYPNQLLYPSITNENHDEEQHGKTRKVVEDDEDSDCDDPLIMEKLTTAAADLPYEELIKVGGKILMLHDEILHQIFAWLPVDAYATLARVSPHWKHMTRTEAVYKRLCERLYLNQSKRRQLDVSRFGGSYRTMLEQRPRVRAAGGVYVLKYSQIKHIQRDMWTEVPIGAILESVYYRYLYFQEDGRVLYALTSAPPHEIFRRMLNVCLKKREDPVAVWGNYQVQKNVLTITTRQSWHTIQFELTIEPTSIYGRFGALTLNRHLSSPSGCFEEWSRDRVEYKVPTEQFQFVKAKFL